MVYVTQVGGASCKSLRNSDDVTAELPETGLLFAEADLDQPDRPAETMFASTLSEIIAYIGRFSPCYNPPAEVSLHSRDHFVPGLRRCSVSMIPSS